jgi:hypothetical protein
VSDYTTTNTTSLTLAKFNTEPVMTIHPDGRVTVTDKLKPDEAAAKVGEAFKTRWMADVQATKIRNQQERIKRLEEAGNQMELVLISFQIFSDFRKSDSIRATLNWNKAKEDKL